MKHRHTLTPVCGRRTESLSLAYKRAFDLIIAIPAITLLLPALLLIAIAIRLDSEGNVLFFQKRVGRNCKPFTIIKFRTFHKQSFGIFLNEEIRVNDYRITRIGRFLRRSKLDELPQLINILMGDMSIVGPRPDIPEQVIHYTANQVKRLTIKPGLTGIAQVSGNTLLSWSQRIHLDLWYIENRSILLDMKIIRHTLNTMKQGESLHQDPFKLHEKLLIFDSMEKRKKCTSE